MKIVTALNKFLPEASIIWFPLRLLKVDVCLIQVLSTLLEYLSVTISTFKDRNTTHFGDDFTKYEIYGSQALNCKR